MNKKERDLLERTKEFIKKESELREKVIRELTVNIINSDKFYIDGGLGWIISLTTNTGEIYVSSKEYYLTDGSSGKTISLYSLDESGKLLNPRKELMPWEITDDYLIDIVDKISYFEVRTRCLNFTEIYKSIIDNFLMICNKNSIVGSLTFKIPPSPLYLSKIIISKLDE